MTPRPIDAMLKSHVQTIVAAAEVETMARITELKASLASQDHFTQAKVVQGELAKVENAIAANDHPFYVKNHSSDDWLITQFANRCLLLNIDESAALKDTVFLGAYRHKIWECERELKASVPVYTYDNFASGDYDPYFMELDHFFNITEDDFTGSKNGKRRHFGRSFNKTMSLWSKPSSAIAKRSLIPSAFWKLKTTRSMTAWLTTGVQ